MWKANPEGGPYANKYTVDGDAGSCGYGVRATEKNNYPTLLVFSLSFCVAASVAYSNMRHLPRLESEQKSGAIFG